MLALVLAVAALSSAASDESRGVLVGGRIGFDFSTPVNSDHWTRTDRRMGVVLGLQVAVPLTHYLWLQPEVSFAGKKFTDWSDSERDMMPVTASYVGVSVIPMVMTRLGPIRAYAGVVPEFTFLVSDTANFNDVTVQPLRFDLQVGDRRRLVDGGQQAAALRARGSLPARPVRHAERVPLRRRHLSDDYMAIRHRHRVAREGLKRPIKRIWTPPIK